MTTPTPDGRNITINPDTASAGGQEIRDLVPQIRALVDQMVQYQKDGLATTQTVAGQPPALTDIVQGFQTSTQNIIDELTTLATRAEQMGDTIIKTANKHQTANQDGVGNVGTDT